MSPRRGLSEQRARGRRARRASGSSRAPGTLLASRLRVERLGTSSVWFFSAPRCGGLLAAALALSHPWIASAQMTLLIRDDPSVRLDADTGADEALRAAGGSVRRLEASLEDMALAAGCTDAPESPPCIVSIATAAQAHAVVVERTSAAPVGWRVALDVRSASSGARLRTIEVSCASRTECVAALAAALEPRHPPSAEPPRPASTASRPTATSEVVGVTAPISTTTAVSPRDTSARRVEPPVPRRGIPVISQVLFVSAAVVSVGAMIAGGIGLQQAHDAWGLGIVTTPDMADRAAALEMSRDWAVGFGTALAMASACLASVGVVMMLVEPSPRPEALALRLGAAATPLGAMVSLDAVF